MSFSKNIKLNLDDKIYITENLAIMLKSGLSLSEALGILEEQSKGRSKILIHGLAEGISSGQKLSACFAKYKHVFSSYFINSIMSGESSGNLEKNLLDLSKFLKKEKDLKDKVRNAMIYPMLILVLGFVVAGAVTFFVLPKITPIFKGLDVELPLSTRILMYVAEAVEKNGLIIFLSVIFVISMINFILHRRSLRPITHWLILKLPIISQVSKNRNLAIAFHTLATMLKSGLSLMESIDIAANTVNNHYYKNYFKKVKAKLNQGLKFSESMDFNDVLFPKIAIGLVSVGERSGNLEEELFNLGEIYEAKVEKATKNMATTIEPLLLVLMGLVVGWLALSIITPIYEITGNLGS